MAASRSSIYALRPAFVHNPHSVVSSLSIPRLFSSETQQEIHPPDGPPPLPVPSAECTLDVKDATSVVNEMEILNEWMFEICGLGMGLAQAIDELIAAPADQVPADRLRVLSLLMRSRIREVEQNIVDHHSQVLEVSLGELIAVSCDKIIRC
jgi:hypothetical protein